MDVISVNVQTGERTERNYTAEELADIAKRVATETARPKVRTLEDRIVALELEIANLKARG